MAYQAKDGEDVCYLENGTAIVCHPEREPKMVNTLGEEFIIVPVSQEIMVDLRRASFTVVG